MRVAVLDANVLYGIEATDLLATMATRRLFRPHWSPEILDEVIRNLRERPDLVPEAIDRRVQHLNRALPAALDEAPAGLIGEMPNDAKDRHVLALAVHVGAAVIVTENVRHFPASALEPLGVEAMTADAFVLAHVDLDPQAVLNSVDAMAARRRRPPKARSEIIDSLTRYLPDAMVALREQL